MSRWRRPLSSFAKALGAADQTFQVNGGAARQLSPRLDAVLDYSYAQFGYYAGQFNPKTFSIGAVYHFVKR
jgi:hypothetical protein